MRRRILTPLCLLAAGAVTASIALAEPPAEFVPQALQLERKSCGNGWYEWRGIAGPDAWNAERVTSLSSDPQGAVWVGTSRGRLLKRSTKEWTLEAQLDAQVTSVAVQEPGRVWVSTGDGIRLMNRSGTNGSQVTAFRIYYQGQPAFVSGGYIPGTDAERLWGYVDAIYIPPQKKTYAPFVISTEHGFFAWGGYHGVWHHFLPHYWGANSPWLDTRELIPHRRPTCIAEDRAGNLWIGTDGDGLVQFNAHARDYSGRDPQHNARDGTEFATFGPKDIGCDFATVPALSASTHGKGLWAVLASRNLKQTLARYDGDRWSILALEQQVRCIAETARDVALMGTEGGLMKVEWPARKVQLLQGPKGSIFQVSVSADKSVFCASSFGVYEGTAGSD